MEEGFVWEIDVSDLLAEKKHVKIETEDGAYLVGVLTDVRMAKFLFMGEEVDVPVEIELNDDQEMRIPVSRIRTVEESPEDD